VLGQDSRPFAKSSVLSALRGCSRRAGLNVATEQKGRGRSGSKARTARLDCDVAGDRCISATSGLRPVGGIGAREGRKGWAGSRRVEAAEREVAGDIGEDLPKD
jgi:hypothetical protein